MAKKNRWENLYPLLEMIEAAGNVTLPSLQQDQGKPGAEASGEPADLINLRSRVRLMFGTVREELAETLTERECYQVLFPLVVYFDERVRTCCLSTDPPDWPTLQTELYQVDNGGDLFYEILEDILKKPQTLPFVYEVFYFCLKHGFTGRHGDAPERIAAYRAELKKKIPLVHVDAPPKRDDVLLIPPARAVAGYYVLAVALIAVCFLFLDFLSKQ